MVVTGYFVCLCRCRFHSFNVFTSMVDTRRDLLARESVMLEVLLLWVSVIFRPLGGSHVPICWNNSVSSLQHLVWSMDLDALKNHRCFFFFSLKLRSHTASRNPTRDTPFPDPPPSDWWHPGRNLFLVHWSCWREHVPSIHPSEPMDRKIISSAHSPSINLKVSSFSTKTFSFPFLSQLYIPSRSPFTVYFNNITRNNKAARIEAGLTGKSSLCMWFIVLEVSLQSHWRSRRVERAISDTGGGGSASYYNGSFWKLPAMIPSTDWKSFVEQSKWLTLTRVKETHRGFDINTGGDMYKEKVGEWEWNIIKMYSGHCTGYLEYHFMHIIEIRH